MILKDLKTIKLTNKLKGTIRSGFKSGDSDVELMVAEPLIQHPEIKGLYRAFDPSTGWKGWVEYKPPVPTPEPIKPPTAQQLKEKEYVDKLTELKTKKELVDLGVLQESDISTLRAEVKTLATELGVI